MALANRLFDSFKNQLVDIAAASGGTRRTNDDA